MIKDKDGNWEPTHNGGLLGYLRWATIHETKTYLGLIARVLPFNVVQEQPEEAILTHEQVLAQLEERGLPIDLVGVLREAPVQLSERTAALLHRRGTLSRPPRPPPRPQIQTAGLRSNSSRW
jgi:hypothetical protein